MGLESDATTAGAMGYGGGGSAMDEARKKNEKKTGEESREEVADVPGRSWLEQVRRGRRGRKRQWQICPKVANEICGI